MRTATSILLIAGLVGCSAPSTEAVVRVSAAASLSDAFAEIEAAFEGVDPDVDVVLNLAGSSTLREQILEGAPTDVFASANLPNMDRVIEAGEAAESQVFATNLLQIAVPPGNPANIGSLEDFANPDLLIGLCTPAVPCGDFARQALSNAGIEPAIDTNEPDVRALRTKIEAGELDAGITYVTDIASAGGALDGVAIPEQTNVVAEYPIAALANAPNPEGAVAFVEFVMSAEGQAILNQYGFGSP